MRAAIGLARPWLFTSPIYAAGTYEWRAHLAWSYTLVVAPPSPQTIDTSRISMCRPYLFMAPVIYTGQEARQQWAWCYAGILAGSPPIIVDVERLVVQASTYQLRVRRTHSSCQLS